MLTDYHVHTQYSDDSEYLMEEVVRDAIALGLSEICFTDHVDYGIKRDWDDPRGVEYRRGGPGEPERMPVVNVNYPEYAAEFGRLKEKYKDQITLKMGMEFGMQTHTIPQYEKLFSAYPFDFIILSVHQVEDKEFWTQDFQKGRTQEEYNLRYYEEILELVRHYHNYSVLGHLDLISRYDKAGHFPFERIRPIVAEILRTVIADGKGIEINTSSHRYGLRDLTPSRDILRLYRDLGGEVITIGSDSHKKEHLGAFVRETMEEMKTLGFKTYYTFDKMVPVPHYFQAPLV
ncbi:MAG: histidinol-phosphatase HisJ family protein [Lachnospiraceae bacterium]|nr:histidinol-phosphatase HisJ family protein [Lachnospiraceae bacterium]